MTRSTATSSYLTQWASDWEDGLDTPISFHVAREAADLNCDGDTFRMTTCKGTFEYLQRVSY